jgi:SagB-type dehydrogenase family enzyme
MGGDMRFFTHFLVIILAVILWSPGSGAALAKEKILKLPAPSLSSGVSIEEALSKRRSIRRYQDVALTLEDLSQILWAAQGITDQRGFRTAPSAGATYPLETYAVVGSVTGVTPGVYRYKPEGHSLDRVFSGDVRKELAGACYGQKWVEKGAVSIVFTAVRERTAKRYGRRAIQYIDNEIGHASQNVYLQAVSLNLGTVAIGAFGESSLKEVLKLPASEVPLYLMPVGRVVAGS